jgi:protein SCO1/2
MRRAALAIVLWLAPGLLAHAAPVAPPTHSLYHLTTRLTDHQGQPLMLRHLEGKVVIVAMFYTTCQYACPLTVETMKRIERKLPQELRDDLVMLMVSFDPERDDVAALARVAKERRLEAPAWRLARAAPDGVREVAAALGLKYRKLVDGEYNHSSPITVLDRRGVLLAQSQSLGEPEAQIVAAATKALKNR